MSMVAGRTSRNFRYTLLDGGELADGVDHHVVHARGKAGVGMGYDACGRQHRLETLHGAGPQAGPCMIWHRRLSLATIASIGASGSRSLGLGLE